MKIIYLTEKTIQINENSYIIDMWEIDDAEVLIGENLNIQYTIIPTEWTKNRHIKIGENSHFIGKGVVTENTNLTIISDVVWNNVSSHLEILAIAKNNCKISIDGVARVEKAFSNIETRVDQTNILIGENTIIRGIPRLEIATDDVSGGHSCKIHRLHGDALFYLQSHGLNQKDSENFLLNSEILRHLDTLPAEKKEEKCYFIHKQLLQND